MAEKPQPVKVLYCGVCGLPAEYCEFGPDFEKCKPWLIQNAPEIYPDLLQDLSTKASQMRDEALLAKKALSSFLGENISSHGSNNNQYPKDDDIQNDQIPSQYQWVDYEGNLISNDVDSQSSTLYEFEQKNITRHWSHEVDFNNW